jgi:hypothetical protein
MSVVEINALLYLPTHPRERLERALRIPALSRGWHRSFEALLEQRKENKAAGNPGSDRRRAHLRPGADSGRFA